MRFRDGIGVRIASADAFGEPIEQLQLCTDLAGLESAVRERVSRLINFRHVRYVRLRGSERLTNATKDVVVTYDAVPGTRLSEFLELALHAPLRIDIDTALQIVRELLPAIAVLHDSRNVTHGAIGPERLVLTPQGRLVIVDHGLGLALGKLGYSRKRLWQQLRVPVPQGTGKIVFDARTDVIQIGMVALALILGRPIEEADFPQNLERLLDGAKETPSIGQSRSLSNELRAWLDRSLPLEKRVAFATVREAQQEFEKLFSGTRYGASSNALKNLVAKYAAVAQGKAPVEDVPAAATAGATTAPEPIGAPMIENAIERGLGNGRRIAEPPPLARPDDHIPAETEVAVTSLADAVGLGPKGRVRATPTRKALVTPITDPHPRDAGLAAKLPANARAAGAPASSSLPSINAKSVDIKAPDVKTAGVVKGDAKSTAAKTVDVKIADVKAAGVKGPDLKGADPKVADAKSAPKPAAKAPLAADVAAFEEVAEDTYTDAQVSIATKGTQAAPPAASAKVATSDVDAQSILLMDSVDDETPLMPASAFDDAAPDLDRFAGMGARNAAKKIEAAPVAKAPEVKAPEVNAPAAKAPAVKAPEAKTPELKTPEPKVAEPKAPALKVEVKAPEGKAPAKAPEVKGPAVNAPTVVAPAAKTPAVNVPAPIAPAAKGPAVNAPAAKVPAANVPVNVPSMNAPAASSPEASPLFSATPAPIAVTPAVPAPPPVVPPVAKIPLPGTPVAQPAAPPAAVAPPKVSVPLPSAVPPLVTPVAPAASIAPPAASSSVPLPVSKTPTPQVPAVAPPAVVVTPVAAPPVVTTPVAAAPVAVTPVAPAPPAPPVVAVTPVAAPPVASTPVTPVASTPVAPPPVAVTPAVVAPVAKMPAPVAATPVVAPPPVAMPNLPEPDLFADAAPAVVIEEPAKKKSLASKLWAAVPKPKKAAPPPSIMSVPEEAEDSVSAPPAFVAPAATQMPAAPAASSTPVVQAAPVAQPATPAAMTPASAKPAATVAPVVPAAAAPVAPVAPAARANTPAAPTTTTATQSSSPVDAPPAAAVTPAASAPEAKKSTTFDWHKDDVAVTDAVPAWARGRDANEAPAENDGAVDFDAASGSLSAAVASASSSDRVSAFMAAPKPVVIKPEKEASSPSSPSLSTSSSSASSSSSAARVEESSSSSENRTLLRPGSGFFGADAADAAAEAEEGEKVVAFKAPRRQMPRIRINWRRTLAASLVVSIMEGVAFATAYWYVIPAERGSLLVETTPAGLEILVDGRVMGRTPFSDSLTPGRHTIELRQGTNSRVIPVEISSGVQTMQRITWAKGLQTGQARVTATAPNSEVTIDGKKWGKAPLTVSTLAAGRHMVQIESDAGTVSTPIAVSPGETTELDVPIYPGWVSVLAPVQLFIYEGERFLGTTEGEKLMLAPGKHTLDFVSEELGYKRSLEVTITPGATAAVSLPMPKVAVTVEGPEGADLIVDGEAMGKLPLTGLQVPLGTRDFVVKHPDHGENARSSQ